MLSVVTTWGIYIYQHSGTTSCWWRPTGGLQTQDFLPLHISNGITLIKVLMDTARGAGIYEKPFPVYQCRQNGNLTSVSNQVSAKRIILTPSPTVGVNGVTNR